MDSDSRLSRALASSAAPKRDVLFTLAVLREAERQRFQRASLMSVLRGAGLAAASAALVVPLLAWTPANWHALQNGVLTAGGILALVSLARIMSQQIAIGAR